MERHGRAPAWNVLVPQRRMAAHLAHDDTPPRPRARTKRAPVTCGSVLTPPS
jgi:hypothetical protein